MYKKIINLLDKSEAKVIQRVSDGAFIPFDTTNNDYLDYLKWLSKGNVPQEANSIPEQKPKTAKERLEELGIDLKNLKKLLRDTPEE
jgi:hypothetical protein